MTYSKANYEEVEAVGGGLHFLRDPLDCENLGVSVLECDPGWEGQAHDHTDEGHEEVYVLVEGEATVTVDGDVVEMTSGDAIRLSPDAERRIENGERESTFVLAGAP